jgi:hypothetical protein
MGSRPTAFLTLLIVLFQPIPIFAPSPLPLAHPRLAFAIADLEALKKKTQTLESMWSLILTDAEYNLGRQPVNVSDTASAEWDALIPAQNLAFAYLMTGRREFARKALDFANVVLAWETWIDPSEDVVDLGTSRTTFGISIVYDWLHSSLNDVDRIRFQRIISEKGARMIYGAAQQRIWWWDRYHNNHATIAYGALGVAALALMGEVVEAEVWLEMAKDRITKVLDAGGDDGGWGEGIHYWQYGFYPLILFVDALRRVTNYDLYQHRFLKETLYFPLYCLSRGGAGFVNFCDSHYSRLNGELLRDVAALVARLASEYRNGYGQWLVDTLLKNVWSRMRRPWTFIWYDPSLSPAEPEELPLVRHFQGLDWLIMRTGWKREDTLLAFKSGPIWNHGHADQNSFILEALGQQLAIDLGYGDPTSNPRYFGEEDELDYHIASVGHNTILVNGQGQANPRPYWKQLDRKGLPYMGGNIRESVQFVHPVEFDYVLGDAGGVYEGSVTTFLRQVVFVSPHYFLMFDQIEATGRNVFEWLMHSVGEISVDGQTITVTKGDVTLAVKFLFPSDLEFQVFQDQLIFEDFGERPKPAPYIKVRPRSKQSSCQFLSILYPLRTGEKMPTILKMEVSDGFDILSSIGGRNQTISFRRSGHYVYLDKAFSDDSGFYIRRSQGGAIVDCSLANGAALQYDNRVSISFPHLEGVLSKAQGDLLYSTKAVSLLSEAKLLHASAKEAVHREDYVNAVHIVQRLLRLVRMAYSDEASYLLTLREMENARQAISKAQSEGRHQGLEHARASLAEAEKALSSGDYSSALKRAREALSLANDAQRLPDHEIWMVLVASTGVFLFSLVMIAWKRARRTQTRTSISDKSTARAHSEALL